MPRFKVHTAPPTIRAPALPSNIRIRSAVRTDSLASAAAFGDDRTDADAFAALRALRGDEVVRAMAVAVMGDETPGELLARADYALAGPGAVERLLVWLAG